MHNFEEETLSCKEVSSLQLVNLPLELLIQGVLREEGNVTWGGEQIDSPAHKELCIFLSSLVFDPRRSNLLQGGVGIIYGCDII